MQSTCGGSAALNFSALHREIKPHASGTNVPAEGVALGFLSPVGLMECSPLGVLRERDTGQKATAIACAMRKQLAYAYNLYPIAPQRFTNTHPCSLILRKNIFPLISISYSQNH